MVFIIMRLLSQIHRLAILLIRWYAVGDPDPAGGGGEGVARSSRPRDKEGGSLRKKFFRPFGPQFDLKIRGAPSPGLSRGSATGMFLQ